MKNPRRSGLGKSSSTEALDSQPSAAAELRARAEAVLSANNASAPAPQEALSPAAAQKLLHELCVQQIELDMQNDELCRTKADEEASRSHAADLYNLAPVGYVSLNQAGLILEANRTAYNRLSVKPGALLNHSFHHFIAREDQRDFDSLLNKLLQTGERQTCEVRMVPADGPPFWAHLAVTTVPDLRVAHDPSASRSLILRLVMSDIDTRKRAELDLVEKEERLSLATLHNGIGIWDWNLVTREMVWDDSMFALYRIHREDFIGTDAAWQASLHPDDRERGIQEIAAAISGEKPFDTIFRVVWPNGDVRHIKAVAKVFRDEQGAPLRMLGSNWDITARIQAEADILKRVEQFHGLLLNLEAGIVCHAPDTSVVMNNQRAAEILGLSDAQMRGKMAIDPAWRLTAKDSTPLAVEDYPVNLIKRSRRPIKDLIFGLYRHGESTITWVQVNGFPVLDSTGNITEILISFIDITARIEAEESLRTTNLELEARVSERTAALQDANVELLRLLAALAVAEQAERQRIADGLHEDVLQRLCAVRIALSLPASTEMPARLRAGLDQAHEQINTIATLLRTLTFDLASPVLKEFGLTGGLKSLCTQLQKEHGIPIRFQRDEQPLSLPADVESVLFNAVRELLRNVFSHARAHHVVVSMTHNASRMELIVEDDGDGFDSAAQVDGFSPTGGYGLFNIRKRMQHLQGEMRITPINPRGKRIVLSVPRAPSA